MKRINLALYIISILFITGCGSEKNVNNPKYVILLIGDGMCTNQIYATELYKKSVSEDGAYEQLAMNNLPFKSIMKTYSANNYTTGSASAITAMLTGHKTNNGVLNKDTSLTVNYETIAEKLKSQGYKIGVVSSVFLNHATPAGMYAHQNYRKLYYQIAKELTVSEFDYFGGGGIIYPEGNNHDSVNIFDIVKEKGYKVSTTLEEFHSIKKDDSLVFSINPETYRGGDFYWVIDKKKGSLSLADFTKQAVDQLKNDKGFFLMVEGGKIDWACHDNDAATCIHEMLDFDKAVAEAIKFGEKHPEETLIIVLGDHETGGMAIGTDENERSKNLQLQLLNKQIISIDEFERILVQLVKENSKVPFEQVMDSVSKYFGINGSEPLLMLSDEETDKLFKAYESQILKGKIYPDADYLSDKNREMFVAIIIDILNSKAGIGWTTYDHTATPVPVRVWGAGSEEFSSYIDNTDIHDIIEKLMIE